MAPLQRLIIDTDPGIDDILCLLLALSARPEEVEVMLLSVTYGNVENQICLRNVITLFHIIEKELEWRKSHGLPEGFQSLKQFKPIIAVGADHPLEDDVLMADHFHGSDGIQGVHTSHPHLSPSESWKSLFAPPSPDSINRDIIDQAEPEYSATMPFVPSKVASHKEILRLLRENPKDTITIVAIGPLTNLALAAAEDTETFLKVKEVVVMGGAISSPGNITPVAEFNTYADPVATARIFALTSLMPAFTMPPTSSLSLNNKSLQPYPGELSRTLNLTLLPLDITSKHLLQKSSFEATVRPLVIAGSPLAEWIDAFLEKTFEKIRLRRNDKSLDPQLHIPDPMCLWYILTKNSASGAWTHSPTGLEDIRIETLGQWTRGMHVVDRRIRRKAGAWNSEPGRTNDVMNEATEDSIGRSSADNGNKVKRIIASPGEHLFGKFLLDQIFGFGNHIGSSSQI